jgi:dipeptidyl-peptidase-4
MASLSLPEQLVRTRRFTLGVPEQFTLTPDGRTVLFLRSRAGDDPAARLWALDLDSGTERLLADPPELIGADTAAAGITAYATDRDTTFAAFVLGGALWTVDVGGGRAERLSARGPVSDPRPDPTGRHIAYVQDGALRVTGTRAACDAADRALAVPDGPDVAYGTAGHTASTAADGRPRGYWWSPDGARLLVARTDLSAVMLWHATDPARPEAAPQTFRYAAAGTANADVTLWLTGLDGARTEVTWDRHAFEYVVGAGWDDHGPYAVVHSRDQRTLRLLGIDPADGGTRVLSEQRDACWVQLVPGLPVRTRSGALVAHTDGGGTRRLTVDGTAVTPEGLQLRAVLAVDGDEILFTASDEPTETHLYRHRAPDGPRRVSSGPGVHGGVCRGGTLVQVSRNADRPGGRTTVHRAGRPALELTSRCAQPVLEPRATRLTLGPLRLRAALYLPSWHRAGSGRLPVLADPYGGAGTQRVTAATQWQDLVSQWFAEQGFAVLVADGRGTPGRGPDWERTVYGDMFSPVLDDQVTAVREAVRLFPDLDAGRVGIRGWSFGGSLAALAVLRRPDVFHAAVAGAGVTDQRLYEAHWRERFLGHPDAFPQRYDDASLPAEAPRLTRPLLLVHGLDDRNVHPSHTLRLSGALVAAGRPHEVLLLPGAGHQVMSTPGLTGNLLRHQARFLRRHLGVRPPAR